MKLLRPFYPFLLLLLLLAVTASLVAPLQGRMNALRVKHELTENTPLENAPPVIAFTTVALGGFRGLIADALWVRASTLQDEGQYFEMFQLASWIVRLQPRFTGAISYQAWNMAYNISVTFSSPVDRWRWVQRGIELLRDEAIPYNSNSPQLYRELSWLYLNKIGHELDEAHRYYKLQLARQMTAVLGEPPTDWEGLAKAPATPGALAATIGSHARLWNVLTANKMTLDDVEREFRRAEGKLPDAIHPETFPDTERRLIEQYLRRHWLTEVYKLDPAYVLTLNQKYGALDWRLPQAHAIYWASHGIDVAPKQKYVHGDRNIFQALKLAFQSGRLIYLRDSETFEISPNIAILPATNRAYLDDIAKYPEQATVIKGAHQNFLSDAILVLYTFGRREEAARLLADTRKLYGGRFRRNIDDYALATLAVDMNAASYEQGISAIQGYLYNAWYAFAIGDSERAAGFEAIATKLWQRFQSRIVPAAQKRRSLPPLETLKTNTINESLKNMPPQLAANLQAALGRTEPPEAEKK